MTRRRRCNDTSTIPMVGRDCTGRGGVVDDHRLRQQLRSAGTSQLSAVQCASRGECGQQQRGAGPGQQTALEGTATACTDIAGESTLQFSLTISVGKATYDQEHVHIPSAAAFLITEMSGIGDNAFGQAQGSDAAINFDKGDALVVMALTVTGSADPPRDQVGVLATAAAGRIDSSARASRERRSRHAWAGHLH
jgi:hypothetical protein